MKDVFTVAYEGSVKKYHNWITQQLFTVSCTCLHLVTVIPICYSTLHSCIESKHKLASLLFLSYEVLLSIIKPFEEINSILSTCNNKK